MSRKTEFPTTAFSSSCRLSFYAVTLSPVTGQDTQGRIKALKKLKLSTTIISLHEMSATINYYYKASKIMHGTLRKLL